MQRLYNHGNKAHANTVNIHLNKNADFYSCEILSSFNKKFNQYDLTTGYSSVKIAYAFYLN